MCMVRTYVIVIHKFTSSVVRFGNFFYNIRSDAVRQPHLLQIIAAGRAVRVVWPDLSNEIGHTVYPLRMVT